jgi:hypothetical protein
MKGLPMALLKVQARSNLMLCFSFDDMAGNDFRRNAILVDTTLVLQ